MADTELDNSNLVLDSITDKIRQADRTARDVYNKLDRFMEESTKKDRIAKDKSAKEIAQQQALQKENTKQPEPKNEAQKSQQLDSSVESDANKLQDNVIAEIAKQTDKNTLQIDNIESVQKKALEPAPVEKKELQDSKPATTDFNVVKDTDNAKSVPALEPERTIDTKRLDEENKNFKPTPVREPTTKPIQINVAATPEKQENTPSSKENDTPPQQINPQQPIEKIKEIENIKIVSMPEEVKKSSDNIAATIQEQQPIQPSQSKVQEPKTLTSPDFTVSSTKASEPSVLQQPVVEATTAIPPASEITPTIPQVEEEIALPEPNIPAVTATTKPANPAGENISEQLNVEESKAQPSAQEPFIAAKENTPEEELPNVISKSQEKTPTLNASDETLLAINKGLEAISMSLKQSQDKIVNSITSLNSTALEILKLLPGLQAQQPSTSQRDTPSFGRNQTLDSTDIIGNFRNSLNITTRGYNKNTVFPGNNSIA